ncbi:MAG: caspase family protein, partial [Saprospiraceae bacterium]
MSQVNTKAGRTTTAPAVSTLVRGTNYLLAIAIDEYVHYSKLGNCVKDLMDIKAELLAKYDFEEENIRFIVNEEATERNILRALDDFYKKIGENDSFTLMYSGHGENLADRDIGCLIPVDAKDEYDFVDLTAIKNRLDSFKAKHIFVVFDSCFSGLILTQRSTRTNLPENYPSRFALTSGRNSPVSDGFKGKNSPFAEAFLTKLRDNTEKLGAVALAQSVLDFFREMGTDDQQLPDFGVINNSAVYRGQYYFYPRNYEETLESQRQEINQLQSALDTIEQQKEELEQQKEELAASLRFAKSQTLAAKALVMKNKNPTLALRVAEAGYKLYVNKETADALYEVLKDPTVAFYQKRIRINEAADWRIMRFSPEGNTIFTSSYDNTSFLWDLQGNCLQEFKEFPAEIYAMTFAPDGKHILTGDVEGRTILWDLQGNRLQEFKGKDQYAVCVAVSPNGNFILNDGEEGLAILWDLQGSPVLKWKAHSRGISAMAFSPDGQVIITGSPHGAMTLWDLKGTALQQFKGHTDRIAALTFSPDGQTILSGSDDQTAILWDLQGNPSKYLKGHQGFIRSVVFSPDGKSVLTGSYDQTARVWDLEGNCLGILSGHDLPILAITFSIHGKCILTGSDDKTIICWDAQGNRLQHFSGD